VEGFARSWFASSAREHAEARQSTRKSLGNQNILFFLQPILIFDLTFEKE
jgi:hypothetical protein